MHSSLKLAMFFGSFALMACGGPLRYELHGSPKAPEADAEIVAEANEDTNISTLQVRIEHLAPPDRIQGDGKAYVVWYRKDSDDKWNRVGTLHYEEDDRLGELAGASVPVARFELMITVEDAAEPESPSPYVLFSQEVSD